MRCSKLKTTLTIRFGGNIRDDKGVFVSNGSKAWFILPANAKRIFWHHRTVFAVNVSQELNTISTVLNYPLWVNDVKIRMKYEPCKSVTWSNITELVRKKTCLRSQIYIKLMMMIKLKLMMIVNNFLKLMKNFLEMFLSEMSHLMRIK